MTSIGTGVAAGVAQSTQAAQQTARERDKKRTENESGARRMRDIVETHLRALEEGDESDTPTQLHVDNQSSEHDVPPPEARDDGNNSGSEADSPPAADADESTLAVTYTPDGVVPAAPDAPASDDDDQPTHHVDITA